jgi:hypothetical protein
MELRFQCNSATSHCFDTALDNLLTDTSNDARSLRESFFDYIHPYAPLMGAPNNVIMALGLPPPHLKADRDTERGSQADNHYLEYNGRVAVSLLDFRSTRGVGILKQRCGDRHVKRVRTSRCLQRQGQDSDFRSV